MQYEYVPHGVCSRKIFVDVDKEGIIADLRFVGGCQGNSIGIGHLAKGQKIDGVIERLIGVNCSGRGTSCPDQLAHMLIQIRDGQGTPVVQEG